MSPHAEQTEPPENATSNAAEDETEGSSELGFGEALAELEAILARIEDDEIDIDELATSLSEAAGLLDVCRGKIRRAEEEVEQVSRRLAPEDR